MKATDAARTRARATLTTRWARPSVRRPTAAPPAAHTAAVPRITTPTPPATAKTRAPMPAAVPATCGAVRRNPKRLPEASSSELFGPGVMEPTSANPASPSSWFIPPAASSDWSCPEVDNGRGVPVLYDPDMTPSRRQPTGPEWVRAWKPVVAGVHEVFHARFVDYAYPPHVHDAWTVFLVDDGWIRYDLETRHRGAGRRLARAARRATVRANDPGPGGTGPRRINVPSRPLLHRHVRDRDTPVRDG